MAFSGSTTKMLSLPPITEAQLKRVNTAQIEVASSSGWWWPFKDVIILSERPTELHHYKRRLHNCNGPALLYPDGWGIWSIKDIIFPRAAVVLRYQGLVACRAFPMGRKKCRVSTRSLNQTTT